MKEKMKKIKVNANKTKCFSYEVTMLVHVIANSELEAKNDLDEKGGIVSKREVKLLNSVELFAEIKNEKESEDKSKQ